MRICKESFTLGFPIKNTKIPLDQLVGMNGSHDNAVKWETSWRHYAEMFGLQLLEETEDGISSSQINQIDMPLRDKINKGLQYDLNSMRGYLC